MPLLREPARHWDPALSLLAHDSLMTLLCVSGGIDVAFVVAVLPMVIALVLGNYLFFAQHSFKRMHSITLETWTIYQAALESSRYMRLNKIMPWFTGNVGFHHIHHLKLRIPFYRLPEAMAVIPELQSLVTTTLMPRNIINCFSSCLWDEDRERMVSCREVGD